MQSDPLDLWKPGSFKLIGATDYRSLEEDEPRLVTGGSYAPDLRAGGAEGTGSARAGGELPPLAPSS